MLITITMQRHNATGRGQDRTMRVDTCDPDAELALLQAFREYTSFSYQLAADRFLGDLGLRDHVVPSEVTKERAAKQLEAQLMLAAGPAKTPPVYPYLPGVYAPPQEVAQSQTPTPEEYLRKQRETAG